MLDWLRGNKDQNEQSDQDYLGSLNAIFSQVETINSEVREIESNLMDSYSSEGLTNLSRRFESISKSFTDYTIIKHHPFFEVIYRSKSRLAAAKNVAKEAKNIAQLFERYTKRPKTYSASNCRIQINRLTGELENLKVSCTPNALD